MQDLENIREIVAKNNRRKRSILLICALAMIWAIAVIIVLAVKNI